MTPTKLFPVRVVLVLGLLAPALIAAGATSPTTAAADDLDSARARLAELRAELESISDRYIETRNELLELNDEMKVRMRQVKRRAKALLGYEKDAEALAVELYMGGGSVGAIEGMLSSETMADLNRTTAYLEFSGEDQQRIIERFVNDTAELEHELDLLDEQREDVQDRLQVLEDIRATVEADGAEIEDQVARLEKREAAELAAEQEAARAAAVAATETVVENPPPSSSAPVPAPSSEADWEAIAMCESGGNWHIDSTYDGGLQFHPNTWLGYGGGKYARYAWQATKAQQIAIAEKVLASQGPGAWPNCFKWK